MKTTWKPHTKHGDLSERSDLPDNVFAVPREREAPLTDATHVRNALARFDQVEGMSDADRDLAFANIKAAARSFREALRVGAEMHQQAYLAAALAALAATEAAEERWERAALLFGAAESHERSLGGLSIDLNDRPALTTIAARRSYCAAQHSAAWREGFELALEEALRLAHGEPATSSSAAAGVAGTS